MISRYRKKAALSPRDFAETFADVASQQLSKIVQEVAYRVVDETSLEEQYVMEEDLENFDKKGIKSGYLLPKEYDRFEQDKEQAREEWILKHGDDKRFVFKYNPEDYIPINLHPRKYP